MNKKKFLICGKGKWGKKVIKTLKKKNYKIVIINSKFDYTKVKLNSFSWVFILTPNNSHFKLVKYFLNKNKNVFCEKPLCLSVKQTKYLISLAHKNKCKLYISDIEKFKNKKIKKSKEIFIVRNKYVYEKNNEILNRLAYHDFYLLEKFIRPLNKLKIIKIVKKSFLRLKIIQGRTIMIFEYDLKSRDKKHLINNYDFQKFRGNPLSIMISRVLNNKVNFKKNQNTALFCVLLINKIQNI